MTGPTMDDNFRRAAGKIPTSRKSGETWGTQNLAAGSQTSILHKSTPTSKAAGRSARTTQTKPTSKATDNSVRPTRANPNSAWRPDYRQIRFMAVL
jgi:hypothetical protein